MIDLIVFDMDGVLADDASKKELPPEVYYSNSHIKTLAPRNAMVKLIKAYNKGEYTVILTGREEKLRSGTEWWLNQYVNEGKNAYSELLMRPTNMHHEKIAMFKTQRILELMKLFKNNIFVYEDNEDNLMMIGKVIPKAKLFLLKDDIATEFDWWEKERGK